MTADLAIQGVTHRFGDVTALDRVELEIGAGCFAVLLGPSGCGKTTLLSILGGFLTPSEGRVMIGGRDVTDQPPAKRPTTTMFQDYALFPHMTLGANVGFGLRMRGVGRRQRDEAARTMLALVGLEDAFSRKPHELSGGQRQRVALARALAVEPDILLLDEPLGALDVKLRRQMQDELKAIQRRVGTTFVHVTHDQEEAMAIADEIIVMNRGEVQDVGTPAQIYLAPKTAFSAAFMGEVNGIDVTMRTQNKIETPFGPWTLPKAITDHFEENDPLKLFFRPEHLRVAIDQDTNRATDADQVLTASHALADLGIGRVTDAAFFGTHHRCRLTFDGAQNLDVIAHLSPTLTIAANDRFSFKLDLSSIVLLPGESS